MYDNVVPLILKNTFGMGDGLSGVVMAMDNVLALFMLPLFGMLSDKTHTRIGRRMPYILGGTGAAILLTNLLPFVDGLPFVSLQSNQTLFIIALGLLLLAMCTYRSPAVALMPDVTPKPLRSKGNAIINLMGALGGVFTLGVTGFLVSKKEIAVTPGLLERISHLELDIGDIWVRENYTLLFLAVSLLMAIAVVVLLLTIRENKLAKEVADWDAQNADDGPRMEGHPDGGGKTQKKSRGFSSLTPELRNSLILILASVFFWFMGYNAVTTAFTKYVSVRWGHDLKSASNFLLVANVGAIISYLPVGIFSTRFGRKRVIQAGVLMLASCFGICAAFPAFNPAVYPLFALIGAAWAMINVNSYPMVVEISKSADVGQFTGYYYTFSMAAQIVTPILSGFMLEKVGYWTLLPYSAVMVAISFVTISLTKHGDSKPMPLQSKLEAFAGDD